MAIEGKSPSGRPRVVTVVHEPPRTHVWILPPGKDENYPGGYEIILEPDAVAELIQALGGTQARKKAIPPGQATPCHHRSG
jgi:hypothetical protein